MTDKDIIKALECYRGQMLFAFNGRKPEIYIHDIIDLINRQQAQIERLKKETECFVDINKMYSEVRAEAVKEFAERLKNKKARYNADYFYVIDYIPLKEIDNTAKEMVGEG